MRAFTWDEWKTFWINDTNVYTKSEGLDVVNYIGLHIWTVGGVQNGGKLEYLLDSGNILNMFEIQKYCDKTSQKDEHLHSKIHCTYPALQYGELYFYRFVSALKLVYFSDLVGWAKVINLL